MTINNLYTFLNAYRLNEWIKSRFPRYTTSSVGLDFRPVYKVYSCSPGFLSLGTFSIIGRYFVLCIVGYPAASLASSTPPQVVTTENVFRYCQIPHNSGKDKITFVENHCCSHKAWTLNKYIHVWTLSSLTCGQALR